MTLSRRALLAGAIGAPAILRAQASRPNIVLIITDDQGYGDLSLHGNDKLQTPHMDSIGRDGVQFTQFHVNPVCSPTRSSLLTGRYYYRTGVTDTYLGRSMMHADEVTLAEVLKANGYRTGLFGKWHLGDCEPLRSIDQGFEESLNCTGGGLTQPSDPPGNTYFDPMLRHNGRWVKSKGYCTDVFMDAALEFLERRSARPFFAYIATNAPHDPLQVDEKYAAPFRKMGLSDRDAKTYGMVKNLDDNVGRLLNKLRELRLEQDTIVLFMTDNGPQADRYNAGMRGRKGTVYQGGLRVPFFLKWPSRFQPAKISEFAAHIDVMPTLLEACGLPVPTTPAIDGRSLMPLLDGKAGWAPRNLYFQWHRGEVPQAFQNAAVTDGRYKLVNGHELYDLRTDYAEQNDIAAAHPDIVHKLRADYNQWFASVSAARNYAPPRIWLGTSGSEPVTLTRQDWRGPRASWNADGLGFWEVDVRRAGRFDITLRMPRLAAEADVFFRLNGAALMQRLPAGAAEAAFRNVTLDIGPGRLEAEILAGDKPVGVHYVDVKNA